LVEADAFDGSIAVMILSLNVVPRVSSLDIYETWPLEEERRLLPFVGRCLHTGKHVGE